MEPGWVPKRSSHHRSGVPAKIDRARTAAATPSRPRLGRHPPADTELLGRHPIGVQQPGHVVVGGHEQAGWIGQRAVHEQQACVDMPVRADQRGEATSWYKRRATTLW